jgi:hypothetical protein
VIYIFNSGRRTGYSTNIQKTLGLPDGCVNKYVYRCAGDPAHVTDETLRLIRMRPNEPACIVFIERDAVGGYAYLPIRLGELAAEPPSRDSAHLFLSPSAQFLAPGMRLDSAPGFATGLYLKVLRH